MDGKFAVLTEKETMWAEMLLEVLRDHEIPYAQLPVLGAAFSMRTGTPERLRIYVPEDRLCQAQELMAELFPADEGQE